MRQLLLQHKKGLSEIVGYVLLIVGAVALSLLVYNYLKDLTPKGLTECREGISLSIRDAKCTSTETLTLDLYNNGKFNIPDFYVKLGKDGSEIRCSINAVSTGGKLFAPGTGYGVTYSNVINTVRTNCPGLDLRSGEQYILEIQPVVEDKESKKWAVCENAIVTKKITCSS